MKMKSTSTPTLATIKTVPIDPDAAKVTDALSRIGYSLEEAMADLLDNAVDARASSALIRFLHDGSNVRRLMIADDGQGMSHAQLMSAMRFGSSRDRETGELGKFGMGLKTAAFSQGRSLTVISRQRGVTCACRWTAESISNRWSCEILDPDQAARWLDDLRGLTVGKSGTLIVIDDLDHIPTIGGLDATIQRMQKSLSVHLGIAFHRILKGRLALHIDAAMTDQSNAGFSVPIDGLDPFDYPFSGDKNYPLNFVICLKGLPELQCRAHIWPPNQGSSGYVLGGANVAKRQGFYFYRNSRLIQAGGWNGWRDKENDKYFSLARVEIELTPEFDSEFRLNVQKSALELPGEFRAALDAKDGPLNGYIRRAEEVYNRRILVEDQFTPVPGAGFSKSFQRQSEPLLASGKKATQEFSMRWRSFATDAFFEIDREESNIWLNRLYRADVLGDAPARSNDAPLVKILLFMLLREDLKRERDSKQYFQRIEEINALMLLAIMEARG